jgi:hypothetical protein
MPDLDPRRELSLLVNSTYPIIYIETWEEARAGAILASVAQDLRVPFYERAVTTGLASVREEIMKKLGMVFLVCVLGGAGAVAFGADSNEPIVESLGHVGLAISDVQPALHFYVDQLGLKEAFRLNSRMESRTSFISAWRIPTPTWNFSRERKHPLPWGRRRSITWACS